jgi:outer membrane biosynthesis protein TonB
MNNSLIYSSILHIVVICILVFGLPHYVPNTENKPYIMVVDLVSISEITNIKATLNKPKDSKNSKFKENKLLLDTKYNQEVVQKTKDPLKKNTATTTKLNEKNIEKIPSTTKETHEVTHPKNVKNTNKEQEKQNNTKPLNSQDAKQQQWNRVVMKSLENIQQKQSLSGEKSKKDKKHQINAKDKTKLNLSNEIDNIIEGETSKSFNPNLEISISSRDAIRSQLERVWNQSAFGAGYSAEEKERLKEMTVKIKISLALDGTIINVQAFQNSFIQKRNTLYQKFVDSAIRAVYTASPLRQLPPESKYEAWKEMELRFSAGGRIQ